MPRRVQPDVEIREAVNGSRGEGDAVVGADGDRRPYSRNARKDGASRHGQVVNTAHGIVAPLVVRLCLMADPGGPGQSRHVDDLGASLQDALGDDYIVESRLGSGGFAVVFLVRDVRLKRKLAVKVLS